MSDASALITSSTFSFDSLHYTYYTYYYYFYYYYALSLSSNR